tara:strand:- start:1854 stop:2819 length:966 start_codon:yes stop_codon:yes gene_type:complete
MRIFFLGSDEGNLPGFAFQCKEALEKLNHEVIYFNYRKLNFDKFRVGNKLLNKFILSKVLDANPDILIVIKGESIIPGVIDKISKNGVKTINWTLDDPFGKDYIFNKLNNISEYDYFFVFDPFYLSELKELNQKSFYLPCAADPLNVHRMIIPLNEREYTYDVSFVGSYEKDRQELFSKLLNFDFNLWGPVWSKKINKKLKPYYHNEFIKGREMVSIFNKTKINLNLQAPQGLQSMNLRTFELPATQSFQLCDSKKELPSLFRIGKEIVVYDTSEELKDKIEYYLSNPSERNKIVEAGYKRVLKEHKVIDRMKEMLSNVKL